MRGTVVKRLKREAKAERQLGKIKEVHVRFAELKWLYKKNTGHLIEQHPKLKQSRRQQRLHRKGGIKAGAGVTILEDGTIVAEKVEKKII